MTLYLSILVSAPAAEIQALNSAGGSYPRSGYDIMAVRYRISAAQKGYRLLGRYK